MAKRQARKNKHEDDGPPHPSPFPCVLLSTPKVLAFSDTPDGVYGKASPDATSALVREKSGEATSADDDKVQVKVKGQHRFMAWHRFFYLYLVLSWRQTRQLRNRNLPGMR